MIAPLLAVARCTFVEVSRQPVHGIIVLGTLAAYALSPSIAMFSLGEDLSLLKDFGVSTLFLSGLLLAASGVSASVGREFESRTAQVLLSKPIGRGVLLLGKLLGVLFAVAAAAYIFTLALLLAARIGPPEDAREPTDWPAVIAGLGAFLAALAVGAARSLRSSRPFGVAAIEAACATFSLALLGAGLLDARGRWSPFAQGFDPALLQAALLAFLGTVLLGALSTLLAVALGRGAVAGTLVVFVAGLSLGTGGPPLVGLLPDLQLFWVGEIFYRRGALLPVSYMALAAGYSAGYSAACLAVAAWVLERREG